jgi:restriction system protein
MAKRGRFLENLMAVSSQLPCWLAVGLAVSSFLLLHLLAGAFQNPATAQELADFSSAVIESGVHSFASIAQFVLPSILLIVAAASYISRSRATSLHNAVVSDPAGTLPSMGWRDFERLVCEALRREGYRVDERGGSAPDGGIDLIAAKAKKRFLVQCKHWKTQQVGVSVIRELTAVVAEQRADGGVVITGGTFTKDASAFARIAKIRLIDGDALAQMLASRQSGPPVCVAPAVELAGTGAPAGPWCPKCGAQMVDRVAKQGKFEGKHFWGCGHYPKCRGVLPGW